MVEEIINAIKERIEETENRVDQIAIENRELDVRLTEVEGRLKE